MSYSRIFAVTGLALALSTPAFAGSADTPSSTSGRPPRNSGSTRGSRLASSRNGKRRVSIVARTGSTIWKTAPNQTAS